MNLGQLIQSEAIGDVLLLELSGSVSSLADHGILNRLDEIRQQRRAVGLRKIVVDLKQAPFFGSSFLEVIRVLWNDVSAEGGRLVLCSPSTVGRDVLHIAKFDQVWPVVETRSEALELLRSESETVNWPSELQALLAKYEKGPSLLREAIKGLTSLQLRTPAPPGNWSVLQIVCHISDFELVYADRMKRVIAEDQPMLLSGNPDRFASKLAYHQRDLEEELDVISSVRRQVARILKTLNVEDFERTGQHSVDGSLTLSLLLERISGHIPHHVDFIERKKGTLSRS